MKQWVTLFQPNSIMDYYLSIKIAHKNFLLLLFISPKDSEL